jgi:UDP-N-acetylmuramoylalanine--D-glutamate ligase
MAGFTFEFAKPLTAFRRCHVLFRSPGVPRMHPAFGEAEAHGVVVTSQTKWFFDHCPARIVGVTGTKGKGTTVSLITRILQTALDQGKAGGQFLSEQTRVFLTGNIGKANPLDVLPLLTADDIVVFELSSFQLQDLTVSPSIGVCLMVTSEHLDHHADLAEYHAAKSAIVSYQKPGDVAIYSEDYPASKSIGQQGRGTKYSFSRYHAVAGGVYMDDATAILNSMPISGRMDLSKRMLRGDHNYENMCAAIAVGSIFEVPLTVIQEAVTSFPGLEHRLEYVGKFSGVDFYNDSIATTPESSIAAVQAFTERVVIILGGSEKHADFSELGRVLAHADNIRGIVAVGITAPRIQEALSAAGYSGPLLLGAKNMQEIFAQVGKLAQVGDVVLLSPACASFDMFANYADRGEQFKIAAKEFKQ